VYVYVYVYAPGLVGVQGSGFRCLSLPLTDATVARSLPATCQVDVSACLGGLEPRRGTVCVCARARVCVCMCAFACARLRAGGRERGEGLSRARIARRVYHAGMRFHPASIPTQRWRTPLLRSAR